jgi:hypothetical protein
MPVLLYSANQNNPMDKAAMRNKTEVIIQLDRDSTSYNILLIVPVIDLVNQRYTDKSYAAQKYMG